MLFNRGIDTVKITALSNQEPVMLNNYIRIEYAVLNIKRRHNDIHLLSRGIFEEPIFDMWQKL